MRDHPKQYPKGSLQSFSLLVELKKDDKGIHPVVISSVMRDMSSCVWLCIMAATWLHKYVICVCALLQHCVSSRCVIISYDIHQLC